MLHLSFAAAAGGPKFQGGGGRLPVAGIDTASIDEHSLYKGRIALSFHLLEGREVTLCHGESLSVWSVINAKAGVPLSFSSTESHRSEHSQPFQVETVLLLK